MKPFLSFKLFRLLRQFQLFTTCFTLLCIRGAFAMIGFFDFATGLGHLNLQQRIYINIRATRLTIGCQPEKV